MPQIKCSLRAQGIDFILLPFYSHFIYIVYYAIAI